MSPERQRLIRLLFDEYVALYQARDPALAARFSENFSGFTGSGLQLVKSRAQWLEIARQDFAQMPGRIGIDIVDVFPQDLSEDVVAVTAFFHIRLPIPDTVLERETARMVVVFRREGDDWKVAHSSTSIPFGVARDGEVYPVAQLQAHNRELQALVEERTQALAQANERLQQLSRTDGLTGIANRRRFDEALVQEWARAQRAGTPLSLVMLDVDWFKHFNDHYGHLAGDACLQTLALTLAQAGARREGDLAARYGGEEFMVLLPATDADAALEVARHLQHAIHALALPHEGVAPGRVTVSFGVASGVPGRGQQPQDLVRRADLALYRAKQGGRDRIEVAGATGDGPPPQAG